MNHLSWVIWTVGWALAWWAYPHAFGIRNQSDTGRFELGKSHFLVHTISGLIGMSLSEQLSIKLKQSVLRGGCTNDGQAYILNVSDAKWHKQTNDCVLCKQLVGGLSHCWFFLVFRGAFKHSLVIPIVVSWDSWLIKNIWDSSSNPQ